MKRSHRLHRLLGYLVIVIILFFTTEASRFWRDKLRPQNEGIEIVINKAPYIPYQEEYEKMLYPTVRISSPCGTGSGVIIDRSKVTIEPLNSETRELYILTAAHVVGNESKVTIELFYQVITKIEATVIITDTTKDLALLRVLCASAVKTYSAHLAPENYKAYLFTPIYTLGCSLGLAPRPSSGIISVIDNDHWEVTSPILPGNSGGPVYDKYTYEVIGIAVWGRVYNGQLITTMAGIVPINQIYELLKGVTNK